MSKRSPTALTREELYQRVWSAPLCAVAEELGVSGNALAKICNRLLVPYPSRGYWAKKNSGATLHQPPLPAAPESPMRSPNNKAANNSALDNQVTISSVRAGSRRQLTRLTPQARREQLIQVAEAIIAKQGLHAASMKHIAAAAGISETQAYNYFRSREQLLVELVRREFAKIRAARQEDIENTHEHYELLTRTTQTYLRKIGERGGLLLTLLSSPDVRAGLRSEQRQRHASQTRTHAKGLAELYGIPRSVAFGCTAVLTTLCLRAGKLIADKRVSLPEAERLCLAMVIQGSRNVVRIYQPAERSIRRA